MPFSAKSRPQTLFTTETNSRSRLESIHCKVGASFIESISSLAIFHPYPSHLSFHCFHYQSYNVVDYFDLSREVVALSMSLFDRFFATRICMPSSDLVLLASIATLHIAIKTRESAIIKLSTLSWFGRGRFSESRIAHMELLILTNLRWLVNPPTTTAFVMHLLLLLPDMNLNLKREIHESSRFLAGR